jgi:hypothetical protein
MWHGDTPTTVSRVPAGFLPSDFRFDEMGHTDVAGTGSWTYHARQVATAQPVNPGFEDPVAPSYGWMSTPESSQQVGALCNVPVFEGESQAFVASYNAVDAAVVESSLALWPGALASLGPADAGSAVWQTFPARAGDVVTIRYNFLHSTLLSSDFAFVSLSDSAGNRTASKLVPGPLQTCGEPFIYHRGHQAASVTIPHDGNWTLGLGVVQANRNASDIAVLLDGIELLPAASGDLTMAPIEDGYEAQGAVVRWNDGEVTMASGAHGEPAVARWTSGESGRFEALVSAQGAGTVEVVVDGVVIHTDVIDPDEGYLMQADVDLEEESIVDVVLSNGVATVVASYNRVAGIDIFRRGSLDLAVDMPGTVMAIESEPEALGGGRELTLEMTSSSSDESMWAGTTRGVYWHSQAYDTFGRSSLRWTVPAASAQVHSANRLVVNVDALESFDGYPVSVVLGLRLDLLDGSNAYAEKWIDGPFFDPQSIAFSSGEFRDVDFRQIVGLELTVDGTSAQDFEIRIASVAGFRLAMGDSDGDGLDDARDNCVEVANGSQLDADGDGCGNACDPDFNQDGVVGIPDFTVFRQCFGSSVPADGPALDSECAESDMTGDGVVGIPDFARFRQRFGEFPGPSGDPSADLVCGAVAVKGCCQVAQGCADQASSDACDTIGGTYHEGKTCNTNTSICE